MPSESNIINLQSLKVVVLPGSGIGSEGLPFYNAAYETWKEVWSQAFQEINENGQLASDHFTRQDFMVGIFHGHRCAALCCFRRSNLKSEVSYEDSWFRPWPMGALAEFAQSFSNGLVVSWVTIHPEYRRTLSDENLKRFSIGERLCEVTNMFLLDCDVELIFGVTRNERSVNQMAKYTGFEVFQSNVSHHGEPADLIITNHELLTKVQAHYPKVGFDLWNSRLIFLPESLSFFSETKKKRKLKLVG